MQALKPATFRRRWAPILTAFGLIALLSGCVIYPAGYGHGGGGGYHERWR